MTEYCSQCEHCAEIEAEPIDVPPCGLGDNCPHVYLMDCVIAADPILTDVSLQWSDVKLPGKKARLR